MAKKKASEQPKQQTNVYIENAGIVLDQPITSTLVNNYMPYAMSVIIARAIPEIDGFKPSHRKILYTLYKMGLLNGTRVKSANAVGEVMKLHPHGDAAIYETMVRLSRGNEALLHPYVDSKGNFGKSYSRDMAFAAARYTEVKLTPICSELFEDIDKDTVDMVDNYDGTRKEPTLLPVRFPSVLVNANVGIAVGMASSICSFNLAEVCETTIALIRNSEHNLIETLPAPDFPLGGELIYDAQELAKIYETGRGSVVIRSKYSFDKANNCIEVTEIPPSTTVEAIMDKVIELVKNGKVKEVADIRDETDLKGLKITIDVKRATDPDKLMRKLFRLTPLQDSYSCNFNVLIGAVPQVLGVGAILREWIAFRLGCVKRRAYFELTKKKEKLHLLLGLRKILLDIDKAVAIIRQTEEEGEVIPNLMIGFGIDQIQAEYVAEIKLRNLNKQYIIKRTEETEALKADIDQLSGVLSSESRQKQIIIDELKQIIKKYGQPRKTQIVFEDAQEQWETVDETPDYPVHLFFTREGYFKKITPQSYRMSGEHKLKEGDEVLQALEGTNRTHLLFFSDKGQVYKAQASDFEDTKTSNLGDYVAAKLGFDEGETAIYMAATADYKGYMLFAFANGKLAKVELSSYETKTRRRKLTGAYSTKQPLAAMLCIPEETRVLLSTTAGKLLLLDTARIGAKSVRDTVGVAVLTVKGRHTLDGMVLFEERMLANSHRFVARTLPSAGYAPKSEDVMEQTSLSD